ncbi:MAG: lactate racemase domain-containing protein, partial [Thermodesulfobacteriota bacterium]
SRDSLRIYIAYGTHFRQSEKESLSTYGPVYRRYHFVHHNCDDKALFEDLGTTFRGTRITLRKELLRSTFIITFGAISHHYFAGYGGGRKLIFPGLGFRDSIYQNHSLFLDKKMETLCLECGPGMLKGNPVAEDLDEIEDRFSAHLGVHGILDENGRVCDIYLGRGRKEFLKACTAHAGNCEIPCKEAFDLVVASAGGNPKDINFIQSHKAVENAAKFVRDNGILILFARCPDGIGSSTFLSWFERNSFKESFQRLSKAYEGNGGTALSMMIKSRRISIFMITDLEDSICRNMGIRKISRKKAQEMIDIEKGRIAVIPNAGLVVRIPIGISN